MKNNRPKHLALYQIQLPLPGIVSILHRISGLLLLIALPFLLMMLQYSLSTPETHGQLFGALAQPLPKLALLIILWAFLQHFFAGLRHLAIDLGYGVKLAQARASSRAVLAVSLALTAWAGAALW